jgi:elongation factor 3
MPEATIQALCQSATADLQRMRDGKMADSGQTADVLVLLPNMIMAFASKVLLQRTTLRLLQGQRYALVGQNGVGKTTMLNRVAAKDIDGFPEGLSCYYIQHEILDADKTLTVLQYMTRTLDAAIASGADQIDLKSKDSQVRAERALGKVGFTDDLKIAGLDTLSGGWRMKLAIARSMLYNADLLLLDEPTNHLDVASVAWLAEYLKALPCTVLFVSHDYDFCTEVCSHVIHIADKQLGYYDGGFKNFQRQCPEIVAALPRPSNALQRTGAAAVSVLDRISESGTCESANVLPIRLPDPGKLDGIKTKRAPVMRCRHVRFTYEGTDRQILNDISVKLTLGSRCAIQGINGAGKTTLLKVLIGELELNEETLKKTKEQLEAEASAAENAEAKDTKISARKKKLLEPEVWKHFNLRTSYVSQHSMHHLEENLEQTPVEYLMRRFQRGRDKEMSKMKTMQITEEERELMNQRNGILEVVGRMVKSKKLYYQLFKFGRRESDDPVWKTLEDIKKYQKPYVLKLVNNYDELLKAKASGIDQRPTTRVEMVSHLAEFGIPEELAMRKIRWMSGGQKCRLVIASACWTMPHMIALDEPTNYLDNETLAALTAALKAFRGGVVTISHNEAFVAALCNETLLIENGKCTSKNALSDDKRDSSAIAAAEKARIERETELSDPLAVKKSGRKEKKSKQCKE